MSIKANVTKTVAKQALLLRKNSPAILFVTGVVSVSASTVLACRATLKLPEKTEELERGMRIIEARTNAEADFNTKKHTAELKAAFCMDVAKSYAPAVILAVVGIASLSGSHYLLNKRNAALTAAFAGLEQTHREYRRRVAQEVGENKEKELHYEAQNAAMHEKNKDGSVSKSRRKGAHESSIYARFFDQLSPEWQPIPEYNKVFLSHQQRYANDRLNAKGHLFLNEVYKELGIPLSKAGQVVGWILSDDGSTDNHVDFGIFDGGTRELRAFVNGEEGSILLDFNVDGNILDRVNFKG